MIASFRRGQEGTLVVWADRPVPLDRIEGLDPVSVKVFDMMGNLVADRTSLPGRFEPVYLVLENR